MKSTLFLVGVSKENLLSEQRSNKLRTIGFYYRCSDGRFRYYSLHRIRECDWIEKDKKGNIIQRVNLKVAGAREINYLLDELQSKLDKTIRDIEATGRKPLRAELEKVFSNQPEEKNNPDFLPVIAFLKVIKEYAPEGSHKDYQKAITHLTAFEEKKYTPQWEKLDSFFYSDYINFLSKEYVNRKTKEIGILNSTINKGIIILKIACKLAVKKGYPVNPEFKDFKKLKVESKRAFITEEKLFQLINFDFRKDGVHDKSRNYERTISNIEKVRDVYVFSFYTGLAHKQSMKIIPEQVVKDKDDQGNEIFVLDFSRSKTQKANVIPLNDTCVEILKKYERKYFTCLPTFTNQYFNRVCKRMFKYAGFTNKVTLTRYSNDREVVETFEEWELLTSHTGRHSAATNILKKTGDLTLVRDLLGHSSVKTSEVYAKNERSVFHTKILSVTNNRKAN